MPFSPPRKRMPPRKKPLRAKPSRESEKREKYGNYGGRKRALRKVGNNSRSREWPREWRTLKREFERDGITRCERCGSGERLTPAHTLKRRHITSRPQMREVAILCVECHEFYELQGEAKMSKAIRAIIAGRDERRLQAA